MKYKYKKMLAISKGSRNSQHFYFLVKREFLTEFSRKYSQLVIRWFINDILLTLGATQLANKRYMT